MRSLSLVSWILVMVLVVGHVMSVGTAYAQQWVWRERGPGASGSFDCEIYGWCFEIFVGEVLNLLDRSQSSGILSYSVDVDGTICSGYGLIPLKSFKKIGESGKATLYVDTSTLPDFTTSCGDPPVPGGPVGIIEINWTPNGEYRSDVTRFYKRFYSSSNTPELTKEEYTEFTASATGVIFGRPINGGGFVNEPKSEARWP